MKEKILYAVKYLGGFWLTRKLIRNKTLILAYHGFELVDETSFRPKLFIKSSTFKQRLRYLQQHCNVIKLEDLGNGKKPKNSVVITIDDGWASTLTLASPILKSFDFPYTVYLTTENVLNNLPIFHILLDYILMKSIGNKICLRLSNDEKVNTIIDEGNITKIKGKIEQARAVSSDAELLSKIAKNLELNIDNLIDTKALSLLSVKEVKELSGLGADIQLHTHSHYTYLNDDTAFNAEIIENQQHIEEIIGIKPLHHCYPSGSYNYKSIELLKPLGILTATTCVPGLCDETTNQLELPRFLDGENISQITFEAEVSGFLHFLRTFKSLLYIFKR
jgi:peptidoglycan/xylan/chitin deacetylase (PgdA/CDA1 family)